MNQNATNFVYASFCICLALSPSWLYADDAPPPSMSKKSTDALAAIFADSDWDLAWRAADELERRPNQAIPRLIAMLESDKTVKLKNTADLIYPGATTFYGHGWLIDYDIDRLNVRAGWLLERITFQDFGFSEKRADTAKRKERRRRAIAAAKAWWKMNRTDWSRYDALLSALRSGDSTHNQNALHWILNGEVPIAGVTRDSYQREILPLVQNVAKDSKDDYSRDLAKMLIKDMQNDEWFWYESKTGNEPD